MDLEILFCGIINLFIRMFINIYNLDCKFFFKYVYV